jgi:hypothetical protein
VYNWSCEDCKVLEEAYVHSFKDVRECKCGKPMEKVWSLGVSQSGYSGFPFTTSHITGSPIEVRSPQHLRDLCKIHGVTPRDDAGWLTKEYMGIDRKGNPTYKESSGVGLPGCWV